MNRLLAPYENLIDLPPKLAEAAASVRTARTKHSARTSMFEKYEAVRANELRAKTLIAEKDWLAALCGEKPYCSAWDGECAHIESALKRVAHDPGSIEVDDCTDPVLDRERCWVTTCNVRGRNAFGAMILHRKTFSLSRLGVEEVE